MHFIDLERQQQRILPQIQQRLAAVLNHGRYINGPEITELEERLAAFAGVRHAIGCSSGTDALLMVLLAWGIGPGDAVFTTPFTFIATAEVIALTGATPVFVDIDPLTFNLDPKQLESAITAVLEQNADHYPLPLPALENQLTPKAILPVDLFGLPADYDHITAVAQKYGLLVLEDAAQSFGATYHGKKSCSLGHAAATSFFPAKPLGGYGDGGAVFTNDERLAAKLKSIREHGQGKTRYQHVTLGLNARLDTMQAAVLLSKLEIFPEELLSRHTVAMRYNTLLAGTPVTTPDLPADCTSAWAQYSILVDDRDTSLAALQEYNIPFGIYYPSPLYQQPAFAQLGYSPAAFPITAAISGRILSLPMHPYLENEEQQSIIQALLSTR